MAKPEKFKYIATTKYNEVREIADLLHTDYDTVFPGYGGQPLYITKMIGDTYLVKCQCRLEPQECVRAVSPNSSYNCSMCSVYKKVYNNGSKQE